VGVARELVGGLDRETWPGFGGARFGYGQQAEWDNEPTGWEVYVERRRAAAAA
jgi:hypothetical protein